MARYLLILVSIFYISNASAQGFSNYVGNNWIFSFLIIPGDKESISTDYIATYFEITSDSTFNMGMSEAVESGILKNDSTLSIKLYHYNSDDQNKKWAESFKIYFCSEDYLILIRENVSYNGLIKNIKGFGDLWYVFSKKNIGRDKEAKKLYEKMIKKHKIS